MNDTKELAKNRWHETLTCLGADSTALDGKNRPCPSCGGEDRFYFDDEEGRGTHGCRHCGSGDGFELVMKMFDCPFKEAAKMVEGVLGIEGKAPSKEEQAIYKRKLEDERKQCEEAEKEAHTIAAKASLDVWEGSSPSDNARPYLKAKGVKAYGINVDGDCLIVPVRINGEMSSIQRIKPDGTKLFQKGGCISGGYHSIVGDDVTDMSRIYIAEGYATGATIREATGGHIAVAFNANNLIKVAKAIRAKLPDIEIIIAGDNDKSNTGEIKGKEAANAVGGKFIMPPTVDDDWNDHAAAHGLEVVKDMLMKVGNMPLDTHEEENPSTIESLNDAVVRLAKLSPLEYDRVRKEESKLLDVRTVTLDAAVKEIVKSDEDNGSIFAEVEACEDEVDGERLLNDIVDVFKRYAILPDHAPEAAALWVLNTYVHDAGYHSPMIHITAPEKACGKSRVLDVFQGLVKLPLPSSNLTPAAAFRSIDVWHPTLLIDEVDTFLKENIEMAGIINSGHTKANCFVLRCDGEDNEPKKFSTWCPKVLTGIGSLRDTTESRCIRFSMRRKLPHERVERLRLDRNNFDEIKSRCARWADDNFTKCKFGDPSLLDGLSDRDNDNWLPLFAIADLCQWGGRARNAALLIRDGVEESDSIDTILLKDIQTIFKGQVSDRIASQRLCDLLAKIEDRPWSEWSKGRAISTNKLAGRLKGFGVHSKTMRMADGERLKGYELHMFNDAFSRYCDSKRDNVTSEGAQRSTAISKRDKLENVTVQKSSKAIQDNDCHVVTFQNGGNPNSGKNSLRLDVNPFPDEPMNTETF